MKKLLILLLLTGCSTGRTYEGVKCYSDLLNIQGYIVYEESECFENITVHDAYEIMINRYASINSKISCIGCKDFNPCNFNKNSSSQISPWIK